MRARGGGRGSTPDGSLRTPSLRRRVTLLVLLLLSAMLGLLAVTTDVVLQNRLETQLEQRLVDRADYGVAIGSQLDPADLAKRLEGNGISVRLDTTSGQTYVEGPPPGKPGGPGGSPPRASAPPAAALGTSGTAGTVGATSPVERSGDDLLVSRVLANGDTLRLSADAGEVTRTMEQVRLALLAGAAAVLLVAALVIGPVVGSALRPLGRITALARSIAHGDRGRRLRPDRPRTELGATAAAFDDMLDEVEGAERRLRDFLSDAAHELRTPIAGLQAASEHLLRADPDREERERVLVALVRESRRAGRLVDDLLLMARIDRGLVLDRAPVDLRQVAEAVVETTALARPASRLTLTGDTVPVVADGDRLAQVVTNLVDNAVRAAGPHGKVGVAVGTRGGEAYLEVTDDGPGVAEEDRERVFERLVRVATTVRPGDTGAGLGLPIARGIARAHGGDLVAAPPRGGRGARFRLTLPAAGGVTPSATPAPGTPAALALTP